MLLMLHMLHMLHMLLLPMLLLGQTLRLPTSGLVGLEGFEVLEGFVDLMMMMMMVLGLRGHFQALEGVVDPEGFAGRRLGRSGPVRARSGSGPGSGPRSGWPGWSEPKTRQRWPKGGC